MTEDHLVAAFQAAHGDTVERTELLAEARQRRRDLATQLHDGGRSYQWIGARIGLTAQAVEGFMKYQQRRQRTRETMGTGDDAALPAEQSGRRHGRPRTPDVPRAAT